MIDEKKPQDSTVVIKSRKEISVSGIKSILGFGEDYVLLDTECGKLEIEGEGMRIEGLSKEEGCANIKGHINSLYYHQPRLTKRLFSSKNK